MADLDIPDLIDKARAGDGKALGVLMENFRPYLRLVAQVEIGKKLQGKVDASDVVQEVFLDANRQFPAFRGTAERQMLTWLREILNGRLANTFRHYIGTQARDIRVERQVEDDFERSAATLAGVLQAAGPSPSQQAVAGEMALRLAQILEKLSPEHHEAVVLRHLEGLSFPQIAERMGKTVDSVEKLWLRGITRLKKLFHGET